MASENRLYHCWIVMLPSPCHTVCPFFTFPKSMGKKSEKCYHFFIAFSCYFQKIVMVCFEYRNGPKTAHTVAHCLMPYAIVGRVLCWVGISFPFPLRGRTFFFSVSQPLSFFVSDVLLCHCYKQLVQVDFRKVIVIRCAPDEALI